MGERIEGARVTPLRAQAESWAGSDPKTTGRVEMRCHNVGAEKQFTCALRHCGSVLTGPPVAMASISTFLDFFLIFL